MLSGADSLAPRPATRFDVLAIRESRRLMGIVQCVHQLVREYPFAACGQSASMTTAANVLLGRTKYEQPQGRR